MSRRDTVLNSWGAAFATLAYGNNYRPNAGLLLRSTFETSAGRKTLVDKGLGFIDDPSGMIEDVLTWLSANGRFEKNDELQTLVKEAITNPYFGKEYYKVHKIKKKSGGTRTIEAPDPLLKKVQRCLLDRLLYPLSLPHKNSMGFRRNTSIKTNAERHFDPAKATKQFLLKVDLKDFFPSITFDAVFEALQERLVMARHRSFYGFSIKQDYWLRKRGFCGWGSVAPCPDTQEERLHDYVRFVRFCLGVCYLCTVDDRLPQGAPTSPYLSNLVMYKLDHVFHTVAGNIGLNVYTRYADDMIVSGDNARGVCVMRNIIKRYINKHSSLDLNLKKIGIFRHGQPQRVTGLNINHKVSVSRWKRDNVRAEIHNLVTGKTTLKDGQLRRLEGIRSFMRHAHKEGWDARVEPLWQRLQAQLLTAD